MNKGSVRNIVSLLSRREVLGFMGGTAVVSLFGCWRDNLLQQSPLDLKPLQLLPA